MDRIPERIRTLNDELRRNLPNCHAVITGGVAALGPEAVARVVKTVAVYYFCHANDPYEEHDFGSFKAERDTQRIIDRITAGCNRVTLRPRVLSLRRGS
jgi:hypothetical protein